MATCHPEFRDVFGKSSTHFSTGWGGKGTCDRFPENILILRRSGNGKKKLLN